MNNVDFIAYVEGLRRTAGYPDFKRAVSAEDQMGMLMAQIKERNNRLFESTHKSPKKEDGKALTEDELKWKAFFKDHGFSSQEDARTWADAISIITNYDVNRFIVSPKVNSLKFPAWCCIVPIGNTNSHNYDIGTPIINTTIGYRFYTHRGERGNDMSFSTSDWRLATDDEIKESLLRYMFSSTIAAENFVISLLMRGE